MVGNGSLTITNTHSGGGAMIGSAQGSSCGDIKIGQGLTLELYSKLTCVGAAIGSGGTGGSCGDITIGSNSTVKIVKDTSSYPTVPGVTLSMANAGAAIGAGNSGNSTCGNITIYSGANVTAYGDGGSGIGCSAVASKCGNITIYSGAKVDATSKWCAAIGSGDGGYNYPLVNNAFNNNPYSKSECGAITIYSYSSGDVTAATEASYAKAIGKGYTISPRSSYSIVGSVNLLNTVNNTTGGIADFSEPTLGETTKTQYEITTDTITKTETSISITKTSTTQYDTFTTVTDSTTTTVFVIEPELVPVLQDPLIIHTGPRQNEELHIFINDMRPKAMGLSDVAINPLEKALEAIDKLDAALEYALNENTQMGAYQQRLNATVEGLIVSQENATASESTIRDADMAKEMAEYTKANILTQSAQAMLAQANQSASSVLSLLQ